MQTFPRPRPMPAMNPDGPSYEMDPSNAYGGGGGGGLRSLAGPAMSNPGIAIGEPNPSQPGGMHGSMPGHMGGPFANYQGPRPGQEGWAPGMMLDWWKQQHPQWGGGMGQGSMGAYGPRPQMGGYGQGPDPRPMGSSFAPGEQYGAGLSGLWPR